jgi:hypothetical protein
VRNAVITGQSAAPDLELDTCAEQTSSSLSEGNHLCCKEKHLKGQSLESVHVCLKGQV